MEKYYTPDIDEFHVGFEYEQQIGEMWYNKTFDKDDDFYYILPYLVEDEIRVKYLDIDDIKELGWNDELLSFKTVERQMFINDDTCTYAGIKIEHCLYQIMYIPDEHLCIIRIDNYSTNTLNVQMFNGIIKNKSELKVLMKQLNIV